MLPLFQPQSAFSITSRHSLRRNTPCHAPDYWLNNMPGHDIAANAGFLRDGLMSARRQLFPPLYSAIYYLTCFRHACIAGIGRSFYLSGLPTSNLKFHKLAAIAKIHLDTANTFISLCNTLIY